MREITSVQNALVKKVVELKLKNFARKREPSFWRANAPWQKPSRLTGV